MWHVIQDPANNQFFRLNESAYHFVAMLDGQRTVAKAWEICNEQLGDAAPTQNEVIQLLGQLYTSNLLWADLPPDAESLFQRYNKRVTREIQSYLMNLLFIRIPLLDPDHFLDRWVRILGSVFSLPGLVLWLALMGVALFSIAGRTGDLVNRASGILAVDNLPLLYVSLVLVKVFHEFGHAFACKRFGQQDGSGGEVHVMGVMFMVFAPLPYVDASSSWAFREKWHRVIVGAGGMIVELAAAAIAAIIWANSSAGSPLHSMMYNLIFIAGVSTLLFNGNPLLRYDGYYILSDLLEIPNLAQRSKSYLYYLVRRYVWGVRRAQSTAHTPGERGWLVGYAVASSVYRVFICVAILAFVADKFFFIGIIMALVAGVTWALIPLGKFVRYLAIEGELERVRGRAIGSTLAFAAAIIVGIGVIPAPDRYRVDGVVEPARLAFVHAQTDGFVREIRLASGKDVRENDELLVAENPELSARHKQLLGERRRLETAKCLAETQDMASAQALSEQLAALAKQIRRAEEELAFLTLCAPLSGRWIAPEVERYKEAYLHRGDKVGLIASVDDLIIRVTAGQNIAAVLCNEIDAKGSRAACLVEFRIRGRGSDEKLGGRIVKILPAGQEQLPSAALGYAAGGPIQTAADDRHGTKTTERFFEIRIVPDASAGLLSGQRVVVRTEMPSRPLIFQWWQMALRFFQRRFQI